MFITVIHEQLFLVKSLMGTPLDRIFFSAKKKYHLNLGYMGEFEVASILLKIFKNVAYKLYIHSI